MAKKCHFMRENLQSARIGPNYVTLQLKWGIKCLKTCWCHQVTQIIGQKSYFKYNLMARNAFFWPEKLQLAKIDQKYLRQHLKWAINCIKTMKFFKWNQVKQLGCQKAIFTLISWPKIYFLIKFFPKNAILCGKTYNRPE